MTRITVSVSPHRDEAEGSCVGGSLHLRQRGGAGGRGEARGRDAPPPPSSGVAVCSRTRGGGGKARARAEARALNIRRAEAAEEIRRRSRLGIAIPPRGGTPRTSLCSIVNSTSICGVPPGGRARSRTGIAAGCSDGKASHAGCHPDPAAARPERFMCYQFPDKIVTNLHQPHKNPPNQ